MRLYLWTFLLLFFPINIFCLKKDNKNTITNESKDLAESKIDNAALFSQQLDNDKLISSLIKSILRITSNGFKSGLEASVRGLFDKPLSSAVTAISVLIGAVAVLAFFESPISPLPVPPLPDPPVGRFPPEHPIWPPPNRGNQQKMSYQPKRSSFYSSYPMNYNYNLANNFMYPIGINNNYPIQRSDYIRMPLPIQYPINHHFRQQQQQHQHPQQHQYRQQNQQNFHQLMPHNQNLFNSEQENESKNFEIKNIQKNFNNNNDDNNNNKRTTMDMMPLPMNHGNQTVIL